MAFGMRPASSAHIRDRQAATLLGLPEMDARNAFFDLGNTLLELIEYRIPDWRGTSPKPFGVGGVHVCFQVADIEVACARLSRAGVSLKTPPTVIDTEMLGKCVVVFFTDPDGIMLEFYQPLIGAQKSG
jgi:catechol 2,3-dioxygenase-like lactoylglutathione lyase family enzyme